MHASNAARFEAAYKNIAYRLQLPGRDDTTINVLQLVCNWLRSEANGRWLIILDNADDESFFNTQRHEVQGAASSDARGRLTLADFLPQSQNGSILITSRNTDIAAKLTGSYKDVIRVQPMSRDESLELLRNKLSCPLDGQATELLAALEYMPLAIIQAAAYINKSWPRTTTASYTQKLRTNDKKRARLLSQAVTDLRRDEEASNSILATWQISFEHIRQERRSAADLLSFMSFFNPQGIPEFLLRDYLERKPNTAAAAATADDDDDDDIEGGFEDDLNLLRSYSILGTNPEGLVFEMHRLVQFATRVWLRSFGGEDRWRVKYLATLSKKFPTGEFGNWSQCRLLLPHVESVVNEEPVDNEEAKWWAQILYNAAWYTWNQGLYIQAEEMIRGSISARRRILGREHRGTLDGVSILALVLQYQGKYEEADQMNRRALEGYEKALGKEHPSTLTSVGNLALVLRYQGKYEEAEQMNRRALEGHEKALGKEHPDALTSAYCLAYLYHQQRRYDAASVLYERACYGYKRRLGPNHPATVACCEHFAKMVQEMKKK